MKNNEEFGFIFSSYFYEPSTKFNLANVLWSIVLFFLVCPHSCNLNIMLFCESAVNRPHYQTSWSGPDEINDEINHEIETDLHRLFFSCLLNFFNVNSLYVLCSLR